MAKQETNTKTKKNKKPAIIIYEIVMYSIVGAVALWGLVYIILGLIAKYLPVISSSNPLTTFNDTIKRLFGLSPLWWGIIIFVIAALYIAISLILVNRKVEKDEEKKARREARLAHLKEIDEEEEAIPVEEVIALSATSEEVVSEPTPEEVAEPASEEPVVETTVEEPAPEPVVEPVSEETPTSEEAPAEEPVSEDKPTA